MFDVSQRCVLAASFDAVEISLYSKQSQRQKLRNQRKDDRHNYNDCRCGSTQCTGWITIPPRNALRAAGVPEATIADLWDDEFVDETLLS